MAANTGDVSRRRLLLIAAGALSVLGASSCKKGVPASCTDTSGLPEADVAARKSLGYTDTSADRSKACENCSQFVPGTPGECGGCKIMKGPIHPHGGCNAFTPIG